jgi:hypothetical protein
VVLAIANFESLACRVARAIDDFREDWLRRPVRQGRRHYDVPADHFTRYDLSLMREQLEEVVRIDAVVGVSLAWGLPVWTRSVDRLPPLVADGVLRSLDWMARGWPDADPTSPTSSSSPAARGAEASEQAPLQAPTGARSEAEPSEVAGSRGFAPAGPA